GRRRKGVRPCSRGAPAMFFSLRSKIYPSAKHVGEKKKRRAPLLTGCARHVFFGAQKFICPPNMLGRRKGVRPCSRGAPAMFFSALNVPRLENEERRQPLIREGAAFIFRPSKIFKISVEEEGGRPCSRGRPAFCLLSFNSCV
ncbi:MAG: hypothetical protein IJ668_03250, partial [Selenomonadaceae bacterium]|nr:hypothetical protein [Selenomonadaceae bacterium]